MKHASRGKKHLAQFFYAGVSARRAGKGFDNFQRRGEKSGYEQRTQRGRRQAHAHLFHDGGQRVLRRSARGLYRRERLFQQRAGGGQGHGRHLAATALARCGGADGPCRL